MAMKVKDLAYEFFKITAERENQKGVTLPSEEEGSGYVEVYRTADPEKEVNPEDIILMDWAEGDTMMNQARLQSAGYEMVHPQVLLNLLLSGKKIPESWRGRHNIKFLGAWFVTQSSSGCCNPMTISFVYGVGNGYGHLFPNNYFISYDDLKDHYEHLIAVVKRR